MMINDDIFGKMNFDVGWIKYEKLCIWGKLLNVKIRVSAYENEMPNDLQKSSYKRLMGDFDILMSKAKKELNKYLNAVNKDLETVGISEILFIENGVTALLCNVSWDNHGVCVIFENDNITAGVQDLVWQYS